MLARCPALLSSKCCRWRCLNHDVLSSRIRVSSFASLSSPLPEVPKSKNQKKGKKNVTQIQVETNLSTQPEQSEQQAPEQPPTQQATTKKPKKSRKKKQQQQQQQPQLQQQQQPEADTALQQTEQNEKATKTKGKSTEIDINIPLSPLEHSQPQRANMQSAREWVQLITFQRKEWKLSRKALATPMTTPTPPIPAHSAPVQPAPEKPPLPFGLDTLKLTACEDEQQRLLDLQTFVQSVSWTQFKDFLISFHDSHWKDALTHKRRWTSFIEHTHRIFGSETRPLVELIGPHLHKLTAETLYQARKNSTEGVPLSGDVPYLVGFTSSPKSCPCSTGERRSESAGKYGCCCYSQQDVEIIGRDATNEETQKRISELTKLKHKVFVENLHPEIGVRELMKMFCKIGHVEAVEIFREKLSGEGEDALTSLFSPEEGKKKKPKKGLVRRQVTGLSPVYAWVYFSEASGVERALLPVVRILGINFLKHEARTHPFTDKRVLHLGNLPQMPIGGFEAYVLGLLNGVNNSNLVQLLHPPSHDSLKESARHGFCLAEFTDHNAALAAFQKLSSGARDSDEKRKLRVGWATEEVDKSSQIRIRAVEREVRTTHQNRLDREVRASNMASLPNLMSGRTHNDDWSDDPDTLNDDYEERPVRVIHSTSGTTSATIGVNGQPSIVLKRVGQFVTRTGQVLG